MTTATAPAAASILDLAGTWQLRDADGGNACALNVPGDVHSALLSAGLIPDPYVGMNEDAVQWVGERDWLAERSFQVDAAMLAAPSVYLNADALDTLCVITINGQVVGETFNYHRRYRFQAKPLLHVGENRIAIRFRSPVADVTVRGAKLAYPIPHSYGASGQKIRHWNLLRKPACHAGWDWGLCLQTMSVRGDLSLRAIAQARIEHVYTRQEHATGAVTLHVTAEVDAPRAGSTTLTIVIDGQTVRVPATLTAGANTVRGTVTIAQARLWWPNGHGVQPLYDLNVSIGDERISKKIGLRDLLVLNDKDAIGRAMTVQVNGRDIFCKGANWIPTDALPQRQTRTAYEELIVSAKQAHMNMLRVWGGGQFEADAFYELCDEHGILLWHDLMFSCSLYPSDAAFLAEIRAETTHQVKRLRDHASIALWCGDNENIGALNWFEEGRKNRDRYLIDYVKLDEARGEAAQSADETRLYWPSSPCAGPGDFSDTFHQDGNGDMHYWSVWHEGKSFDAYYDVKPRFCSEFGYQSFNSLDSVKNYCPPDEWNITAPTMEFHQRNDGGNRRINEMFSRYFRMPVGFAATLYLSQVQQALAIKTAVEYWRTLRPQCMGTLYWQLNDLWPVASWASLEYGGKWKQLHHHARRFYAPVVAVAVQKKDDVEVWAVSDLSDAADAQVTIELWSLGGAVFSSFTHRVALPAGGGAVKIGAWPVTHFAATTADRNERFMQLSVTATAGGTTHTHANTHAFTEWKRLRLPDAKVTVKNDGFAVTLSTDAPALFVHLNADGVCGEFDDNSITLLPGRLRTLTFAAKQDVTPDAFAAALSVLHLRATY